jgi:RNA binding exosome subunit
MFAWLELRTYCHATEDQEKVAKALGFICPQARLTFARAEGYNRNPILVMTARTDSSRAIKDFWRLLHRESLVDTILQSGGKMVDDNGVLHLRLGKQEAFMGKAILTDRDDVVSVRIKIARQSPQKRHPFEIARETIEELTKADVSHT